MDCYGSVLVGFDLHERVATPTVGDIVRPYESYDWHQGMTPTAPFRLRRIWQRRLSGVLSAALCVWLLAFATHLHASDQDLQDDRSGVHFCGVCASISSGAAAPAVVVFASTPNREQHSSAAHEAQVPANPALASYRSRAPPAR
jgi:hypothetical protein